MKTKLLTAILFLLATAIWLGQALYTSDLGLKSRREGGLMARVFDETRDILGQQMIQRADLYFHGGIRAVNCKHGLTVGESRNRHHEEHADEHDHEEHHHDHADHEGYAHAESLSQRPAQQSAPADWLTRLNKKIHPRTHKHISGRDAEKELLPWLWAALKADPHNVSAFNMTAYWLANRLDMPQKGLDIVSQGILNNPSDFELEVTRGEILWHNLQQKEKATKAFQKARAKFISAFRPGEKIAIPEIPERDRLLYDRALCYLANHALQQGRGKKAIQYFREAIPYANNPHHLHYHIEQIKSKN